MALPGVGAFLREARDDARAAVLADLRAPAEEVVREDELVTFAEVRLAEVGELGGDLLPDQSENLASGLVRGR